MHFLFFLFPFFLFANWAEETLAKMTLEQKIGQLFVAPACPLRGEDHWADWQKALQELHIGNVILKHSDPATQVDFLNRLQTASELPLLVTADAEWGLSMRMSNTIVFPRNMTLGALEDIDLIYQMGQEVGRQARRVGIHMNLAPVADVNNNPANPVIGTRSFGEDPQAVSARVLAYASGLQAGGCLACAKHFPGHGDTNVDSHRDLPAIEHPLDRLERVEFTPFQEAVKGGIAALMTAHLSVPAIDPFYPTSLSRACLDIARQGWHFQGLIVSDALNMKAVADRYSPEEVALLARKAGCDLLLYGDHIAPHIDEMMGSTIPRAFEALKRAYLSGELSLDELDASVLRILRAKERLGLHLARTTSPDNLLSDLHTPEALALKKRLFQEAVTLIGQPVFPLPETTHYISFGANDCLAERFNGGPDSEHAIIAIHQTAAITDEVFSLLESWGDRAIVCLFVTPYALKYFKEQRTVLVAYENDPDAQEAAYRVLTGQQAAKGRLPITQ